MAPGADAQGTPLERLLFVQGLVVLPRLVLLVVFAPPLVQLLASSAVIACRGVIAGRWFVNRRFVNRGLVSGWAITRLVATHLVGSGGVWLATRLVTNSANDGGDDGECY